MQAAIFLAFLVTGKSWQVRQISETAARLRRVPAV
jgi:hypothetical protein